MASEAFWSWLVSQGYISGDPTYYSGGDAQPEEVEKALRTAWDALAQSGDKESKAQFWGTLVDDGYIEGDPNYYASGEANPDEFDNAFRVASGVGETSEGQPGANVWEDLVNAGVIEGDPNYYDSGDATEEEYSKAIEIAFKGTDPGSALRKGLIDFLYENSGATGDREYWYSLASDSGEVTSLTSLGKGVDINKGGEGGDIKALPKGSYLVNVNGEIRVVWDLGDGLGSAWYSIDEDHLKSLYGEDWQAYVAESFGTEESYIAKYGDYHWGNIAEVQITSDNPWEDLKRRTFEAFGYVAGFDDPEVKRLILQGHFENWTANEFLSHYQNTEFYKSTTDVQRAWGQYGPEERDQRIQARAAKLVEEYRNMWGVDPVGGIANEDILAAAEEIESGQISSAEWSYNNKRAAEGAEDSPAYRRVEEEERAQGESEVSIENRGGYARERWEYWMGPTALPGGYTDEWGRNLYMNKSSEEDLESYLRELSHGSWELKPENLGWGEWAATSKSNMRNLLELTSVDDQDPLLNRLLNSGLSGQDATLAIRKDPRFRSTNRMFDELSQSANSLGRTFGFIA